MISITGATGFLGATLTSELKKKYHCVNIIRSQGKFKREFSKEDLASLKKTNVVIHLAACTSAPSTKVTSLENFFYESNVLLTQKIAKEAAKEGVKRLIFISSIGVNGTTTTEKPFTNADTPNPKSLYSKSKLNAELILKYISAQTGMEIVIIRPPLIYGGGSLGKFSQLIKISNSNFPLPFGKIQNKRNFIYVLNLTDLIINCIDNPLAANQIFLASDNEHISTTRLLRKLRQFLGRQNNLIPLPKFALEKTLKLIGKNEIAQSLCSDLQIDIEYTKLTLNWSPPISVDEALKETASVWLAKEKDLEPANRFRYMIRLLDIFFAFAGIILSFPILILVWMIIFFDTGSPFFCQTRVGQRQRLFTLIKFRTMQHGTPSVATHLVNDNKITPFGHFLRRTKIDELPQLWNVLKGEMSLVGPRPCLPSQKELIEKRASYGVFKTRPGITGSAQIQNIDMSTPEKLAITDAEMLANLSLRNYFYYIIQTVLGKGSSDKIKTSTQNISCKRKKP